MAVTISSKPSAVDSWWLEPSREIEKSSSYRELEANNRKQVKNQLLLYSEHFNHI